MLPTGSVAPDQNDLARPHPQRHLERDERLTDLTWKESRAADPPFRRMRVRLKREIVTMGVDGIDPNRIVGTHVEPQDWNALIQDPEVAVIDTRNDYEVAIGTFAGARSAQQSGKVWALFLRRISLFFPGINDIGLFMITVSTAADMVKFFRNPIAQKENQEGATKPAQNFGHCHRIKHRSGTYSLSIKCYVSASHRRTQGVVTATKRPSWVKVTGIYLMQFKIAFQGELGAYSHEACREAYPDKRPLPCRTFEDAIEAVRSGTAVALTGSGIGSG